METQNYANHRRYVPMYHRLLRYLLVLTFIGSLVNIYLSFGDHQRIYSASLITVLTFCALIQVWYSRELATKVQNRAIRAEENLRHFAMTGKLLDPNLKMGQIVALRFASDEEYLALAKRAVQENLSREDIKKAIKTWRADNHRA
jgi:Family of unknown function (DUF6526)